MQCSLEFMLLRGEIAESFRSWRRTQPDLGKELAEVGALGARGG